LRKLSANSGQWSFFLELKLSMKDFRELKVWKKAHNSTLKIYKNTKNFPERELHGLTSKIRRSCASVPTNIAEGCGRSGDTELNRFLNIAMGSANELEYLLLLSNELNLLSSSDYEEVSKEIMKIKRMLAGFIKKLKADC